jgi:hypothetical protein
MKNFGKTQIHKYASKSLNINTTFGILLNLNKLLSLLTKKRSFENGDNHQNKIPFDNRIT